MIQALTPSLDEQQLLGAKCGVRVAMGYLRGVSHHGIHQGARWRSTFWKRPRAPVAQLVSLARQEWPDLSVFDDPEVVLLIPKRYHVALV